MDRKTVFGFLLMAVVVLVGCSGNQIVIQNEAAEGIYFLFRGTQYFIDSAGSTVIDDAIPNGTYPYSTTYILPSWATTSTADDELSGSLTFYRNQTEWVLLYGATYTFSTDSLGTTAAYEINCNLSSNDPVGGL